MKTTQGFALEDRQQAAVVIALRTGLLLECREHGEIYDSGRHDIQGACMTASYLISRGDPTVAAFEGDRATLLDMLKSVCTSYGRACSQCGTPLPGWSVQPTT